MVIAALAVLALAGTGVLYQQLGARRGALRCPAPGTLIDAGSRRLHVVSAGSGAPAVLFEAGIAASSVSWSHVLPKVATMVRACAYDRAGLAWSDTDPRPRTLAHILEDLELVIERSAITSPMVLVGHSFGCFVICAYAKKHPSAVAGLVLVDPPATSEWQSPTPDRRRLLRRGIRLSYVGGALARLGFVRASLALLTGGAPRIPGTLIRTLGPTADAKLRHLVTQVRKLPREVYPVVQEHWCDPKCFSALAGNLRVLQEAAAFVGSLDTLQNLPVVVISSGQLPADQLREHAEFARLSSSGRHAIAQRSGHWIQFDEPDLIVEAIRSLLGSYSTGASTTPPSNR